MNKAVNDEIAEEVPESIIDDDPSVDDELAKLFVNTADNDIYTSDSTEDIRQEHTQTQTNTEDVYYEDTQKNTKSQLVYEDEPVRKPRKKKRKLRRSVKHTVIVFLLAVLLILLGMGCYGIYSDLQPSSFS